MPTDATGTPTSLGIPKYNVDVDAPSGLGFNAAMDEIDTLIAARVLAPTGIASGEVPVWNGTTWVRSSVTPVGPASLGTGTRDGTKFLRDDGTWQDIATSPSPIVGQVTRTTSYSSSATTYAGASDIFSSALTFTADGTSNYLVVVYNQAPYSSMGASNTWWLALNVDSAQGMNIASRQVANASYNEMPLFAAGFLATPSAASHTVNARVYNQASGTTTFPAGAGSAGGTSPTVMYVMRLS